MEIQEQVRVLRRKMGMTQMQLSIKSGLPQTTISNIENQGTDPTGKTLKKLAIALGVTTDELLDMKGGSKLDSCDDATKEGA